MHRKKFKQNLYTKKLKRKKHEQPPSMSASSATTTTTTTTTPTTTRNTFINIQNNDNVISDSCSCISFSLWRARMHKCAWLVLILIVCACALQQRVKYVNCVRQQQHAGDATFFNAHTNAAQQPYQTFFHLLNLHRNLSTAGVTTKTTATAATVVSQTKALPTKRQLSEPANLVVKLQGNNLLQYTNNSLIVFKNYVYKRRQKSIIATMTTTTTTKPQTHYSNNSAQKATVQPTVQPSHNIDVAQQHNNITTRARTLKDASTSSSMFENNSDDDNENYGDGTDPIYMLPNKYTTTEDNNKLMRLVMDGLQLQRLPDMSKVNISQAEYASKYCEYLQRLHGRKHNGELHQNDDVYHSDNATIAANFDAVGAEKLLQKKWFFTHVIAETRIEPASGATQAPPVKLMSATHRYKRDMQQQRQYTSTSLLSLFYGGGAATAADDDSGETAVSLDDDAATDEALLAEMAASGNAAYVALNSFTKRSSGSKQRNEKFKIILHFPLHRLQADGKQLHADDIEEANIRMMLVHSPALALKHQRNHNKNGHKSQHHHKRKPSCATHETGGAKQPSPAAQQQQRSVLNLKVYQRLTNGRRLWLDGRKIEIGSTASVGSSADGTLEEEEELMQQTHSQWLQFDVTKAVEAWLRAPQNNYGLEVQCENCQRIGARILSDSATPDHGETDDNDDDDTANRLVPVLNIIGQLGKSHYRQQHTRHQQQYNQPRQQQQHHYGSSSAEGGGGGEPKDGICHKEHQRCCRHTMEVVFKELKGFEFIIQPKAFDAGYCFGRCPPRFNPAHHHAMLQSLIWKQNRKRAPRLCCAPSKLVELEVLHVDEKDNEKLKISTWTDMRVVECACS